MSLESRKHHHFSQSICWSGIVGKSIVQRKNSKSILCNNLLSTIWFHTWSVTFHVCSWMIMRLQQCLISLTRPCNLKLNKFCKTVFGVVYDLPALAWSIWNGLSTKQQKHAHISLALCWQSRINLGGNNCQSWQYVHILASLPHLCPLWTRRQGFELLFSCWWCPNVASEAPPLLCSEE